VEGPQEDVESVPVDDRGLPALSSGATLGELAEKLASLREHLDQVLSSLNSGGADRRLRCRECGRVGSKDEMGWTLRLYGDDELHACCLDCDTYLSANGA
jgi:hypothetical protein